MKLHWAQNYFLVSILLLLELPWWPKDLSGGAFFFNQFQSFFYWNCLGGILIATRKARKKLVSILLLLELPWWQGPMGCITWMRFVSILLLLELPWWQMINFLMSGLKLCFNPSFTGIALVADGQGKRLPTTSQFQSFFYWNCLGGCTAKVSRFPRF